MMKKLFGFGAFAVCAALLTGCDPASATSKAASAGASAGASAAIAEAKGKIDDVAEKAKAAMATAKEEAMKAMDLTKIDEAAGKLTGDAKTAALAKIADLKKMVDELKAAPSMEKFNELKDKAMKMFEEVKKMVGL